jgi:hypothetical protein
VCARRRRVSETSVPIVGQQVQDFGPRVAVQPIWKTKIMGLTGRNGSLEPMKEIVCISLSPFSFCWEFSFRKMEPLVQGYHLNDRVIELTRGYNLVIICRHILR